MTNARLDRRGGRLHHESCAIGGCGQRASFGIEVNLRKDKLGTWLCREHWFAHREQQEQERKRRLEELSVVKPKEVEVFDNARDDEITVPMVVIAMGIEPERHLCWAVGNEMRDLYQSRNNNALPPKKLFKKTGGHGSHCFAAYPGWYRPDIEKRVRKQLEFRKWEPVKEPTFDF